MKYKKYWIAASIVVVVIFLIIVLNSISNTPGKYDDFASCLKNKGVVFYGTFWCSHCQRQKSVFGKSAKLLPYVECSTSDGRGQLPICLEKKIESYPTWEFSDGSREVGELSFEKLAEKSDCKLP